MELAGVVRLGGRGKRLRFHHHYSLAYEDKAYSSGRTQKGVEHSIFVLGDQGHEP